MGKGGASKKNKAKGTDGADDDDALLNAAIAENRVLQEKAASEACKSSVKRNLSRV